MLRKNLLRVAKQHGHSVQTMLDVYAAWIEGATESDLQAIRLAMESSPRAREPIATDGGTVATSAADGSRATKSPQHPPEFGIDLALEPRHTELSRGMRLKLYGGKGGTRTQDRDEGDQ